MSRNATLFWNTLLDNSVTEGSSWRPSGVQNGYSVTFRTTDDDVLGSVETFLHQLDESVADLLLISHGPDQTIVLYFCKPDETVSLVFSKGSVSGSVTVDGVYTSDRFGLISEFEKGSVDDGLALASAVF